jgi:hypothetical protein
MLQNRPIGRQQMISAVWGDAEPRYATNLLHRHVSGLRRVLEPDRPARTAPGQLTWTEAGYLLTVPAGSVDLEIFDRDVDRARRARTDGDRPAAAAGLRSALALWRGPACEGLPLISSRSAIAGGRGGMAHTHSRTRLLTFIWPVPTSPPRPPLSSENLACGYQQRPFGRYLKNSGSAV